MPLRMSLSEKDHDRKIPSNAISWSGMSRLSRQALAPPPGAMENQAMLRIQMAYIARNRKRLDEETERLVRGSLHEFAGLDPDAIVTKIEELQ